MRLIQTVTPIMNTDPNLNENSTMKISNICLLFLTSCTLNSTTPEENSFEYYYYQNGNIKTVYVFKDSISKTLKKDYYSLDYDSIGNLLKISTIVDSIYNNYSIEYHIPSGNKIITSWENNQKHGLILVIDKYGRMLKKIIANRDKAYAVFTCFISNNSYITTINFILDTTNLDKKTNFKYAGQYYQDKEFKIIRKNSHFYFVKKMNEPEIGEEHTFRVYCNFSTENVTAINLKYEIDHKSYEVESENKNYVNSSVFPYRKGVNVLIGSISIGTDTIINGKDFIKEVRLPFVYQFVCD